MDNSEHILVVDDDREIRQLVGDYLRGNGFRISLAADGRQMREALDGARIDLIVLDLMLPGEDGLSLCRTLRATPAFARLPILMLTARGEAIDRVVGLEMGADDYLPKPFEPRELLARIRNILRRVRALPERPAGPAPRYRFAGWTLDTGLRQLASPQAVVVPLSGAEYRLLQIFLAHPQRVLSRDQLMDLTKGRDADPFDRSIDLQISRLRQKLGDDARAPTLIKTVRNEGYVLATPVEESR
ncbi:response regulator [Azospira restricta]|uniref:Response regulator n=1 Tax=Azospira restricta TaxID=404405 RepID=A0A974Y5W6_9RHOO|nr:response regulator [Azospira restricta]QRJ65749.1 response regulator [Azospira restricta]